MTRKVHLVMIFTSVLTLFHGLLRYKLLSASLLLKKNMSLPLWQHATQCGSKRILKDMGHIEQNSTPILCDNNSAIALSKHHVFHTKRKHIDTHYHFIRELVKNGDIHLLFCGFKEQLADLFTKPLGKYVFHFQCQHLGITSVDDLVSVHTKGNDKYNLHVLLCLT